MVGDHAGDYNQRLENLSTLPVREHARGRALQRGLARARLATHKAEPSRMVSALFQSIAKKGNLYFRDHQRRSNFDEMSFADAVDVQDTLDRCAVTARD